MKKYFLHILWVSLLGVLAVSCSDEQETMNFDSSKAQVVFSVALDTPIAPTRAAGDGNGTWVGDYSSNPGDEYDNHIDMSKFIVKIEHEFGECNVTECNVTDILKWKKVEGENADEYVYQFVGIVEGIHQVTALRNPKIYVYANMGETTPAETFSQTAENIPMWGVKKVEGEVDDYGNTHLTLTPGTRVNMGTVSLLRAMAKLEVKLGGEMPAEYELTGATLNRYNTEGNTHPTLTEGFNGNTESLGLEGVLNENKSPAEDLALVKKGSSYVVYLPEVVNGTTEEDLLKITVQLKETNGTGTEEGSFFIKDYSDADNPVAIDIIRNHWYQYTIKGFAASEIQVSYNTVPWTNENIYIGGEGFLYLNRDVIEIYNSNIDAEQLKFYSSTPIKSITLKDLYSHDNNGKIVEGNADGVSAYYLSKYGQKIQLGTDPGFSITDEEAALAREQVILSKIKAEAQAGALKGGITITSPFLADPKNEITELQQSSHYDTPRYLEFEVINEDDLKATFRVVQYPPVVITNEEGYFSYREDFRVDDVPIQYYSDHFTKNTLGSTIPEDNGEPTHYLNPIAPFFTCADFYPYHVHEVNPETNRIVKRPSVTDVDGMKVCYDGCGSYIGFDEMTHGLMEREYMRVDEYKGSPESQVFHRSIFKYEDGTPAGSPAPYLNYGPMFEREVEVSEKDPITGDVIKKKVTKYYRRHYTGNSFIFYFALFVQQKKDNGKAVINSMAPTTNPVTKKEWGAWGLNKNNDGNHRMYHIRTTTASSEYTIGWPALETEGKRKYAAEGEANSRMVSPSFMVASQLGTTTVPYDRDGYDVPEEDGMYVLARRHCEQYVEAVYEDTDKSGGYTPGDSVTHYDDWRLPTRAEIELIIQYQRGSRAMDKVLTAESYFCASSTPGVYNSNTVLTYLNKTIDQWTENDYHIRCVRDVKPGQELKKVTYPIENRQKEN